MASTVTDLTEEKVDAIQQAFLSLMMEVEEVEETKDYRPAPDEPMEQNVVCMYFDWEEEVAHTAGAGRGPVRVNWSWQVDIYIHGYEAREMQRRLRAVILKMREKLRSNRLLNRTVKKTPQLNNLTAPVPVNMNGNPGLVKRFRLIVEREV